MSTTVVIPSATMGRRRSSSNTLEKFPDLDTNFQPPSHNLRVAPDVSPLSGHPGAPSPQRSHHHLAEKLDHARSYGHVSWQEASFASTGPRQRDRQKSLSEAFRTIRTRSASVSENAAEIAEALKAPLSIKLVTLCLVWYMSSALTNTSSKSILNAFPKPITLTIIQFAFVSGWCIFFAYLAKMFPSLKRSIPALRNGIRYPDRNVIATTLPLALFQIGGHILSSSATEKIPVSLVHTIKGLSPLFTVLAYRLLYDIRYPSATYISLVPLTLGVILACSVEFSSNLLGILCAFCSALIFVTQNIFSKKLFNDAARAESDGVATNHEQKLDKLNLLCYCSGQAFLLTLPIWLWTDAVPLYSSPLSLSPQRLVRTSKADAFLPLEFFFNGIFHFGQNILAFILLSMTSPVTYSVASLIKRVFVIVMAIVWFGNKTTAVQGFGIALTCFGLYLYDRTSAAGKADRRARLEDRHEKPLLPLASKDAAYPESPAHAGVNGAFSYMNGYTNGRVSGQEKRTDAGGPGRPRAGSTSPSPHPMPPGTRQEDTWKSRDRSASRNRGGM